MVESQSRDDSRNEERVLVDRLIQRQGLSRDEAIQLVDNYRDGKPVEIDPLLMEGLEKL